MINKYSFLFLLTFAVVSFAAYSLPKQASAASLDGYVADHRDWDHRVWHHYQVVAERQDWCNWK